MRLALIPTMFLASTGCSFAQPVVDCDDASWEPGQTCDRVLEAARSELPPPWEIETLTAVQGNYCPPAARCPLSPFVVTVYADLVDGRQLYVSVDLRGERSLTARPAAAVEPAP